MNTRRSKLILHLSIVCTLLASLLGSVVFVMPAYAAGIIVNSNADTTADDGACTLREAITNAKDNAATYTDCAAGSGTDTITFDASLSGETIYLASTLAIESNLTVDGSALTPQVTISGDSDNDGDGDVRVFFITLGATATLDSLTIKKGTSSGTPGGGGIYNEAGSALTITNSTLSGNSNTSGPGGGIRNDGTLTVANSTFSGNSASGGSGGGIRNIGALTVTNSTFFGNTTTNSGGGIYNRDSYTLTVTNSTFSGNAAGSAGGGIYYDGGTLNYANTIIANSVAGGDCAGSGTIGTNTNNLVEDGSCSGNGINFVTGDPNLDSLKDNSGPTQTMALGVGSSAIDAGDDSTCTASPVNGLDQRGVARPVGTQCDIGAYEGSLPDTTAPTVTSFTATSPSTSLNIPITAFTASDSVGVTGYMITETSTPPSSGAAGWTASAPSTYTVSSDGSYTLYPWAKDAAGNISAVFGSPASVTVDTTAPTVTSFSATSPSASRNIPITAFAASDSVGVIGYMITASATPPAAGAAGWTGSAPTVYTVGSDGAYTLYPWAKDATGHVSAVFGSPASINVDTDVPTVVSSVRANLDPSAAASVDFIVTFSEAVTGVDSTDFSLSTTGSISGVVVSGVSGSGTTYTVTVNTGSGSGTIRLDVADNDTIVDAAANPLGASGVGNGAFTSGEAYTISRYRIYIPFVMRNA